MASAEERPLCMVALLAIFLKNFLAKGVQSPRVSTTRGMKILPVASTCKACRESLQSSPCIPADPAVCEERAMLPGVSGLRIETSK